MEFTREELQELAIRARHAAEVEGLNPFWVGAYWALADAANILDAMMARCGVERISPIFDEPEIEIHEPGSENNGLE